MGLTDIEGFFAKLEGERCFYCGGGLLTSQTYVYWDGYLKSGEVIFLHTHCALTLAKHLVKDALVIRRQANEFDDKELAIKVLQIVEEIDRLER